MLDRPAILIALSRMHVATAGAVLLTWMIAAGETLSRLAKPSSMVAGRMICPVSANGAPDCKLGADKLCQSKGFKEGNSLNTDSAESCSAKLLIPGRTRKPDDCRRDNYVTHALCQ